MIRAALVLGSRDSLPALEEAACVKELRIVKSAGLDLDVAGLLAISQWEFEPARQGSQAIPVRMTVTVTFSIHP